MHAELLWMVLRTGRDADLVHDANLIRDADTARDANLAGAASCLHSFGWFMTSASRLRF